MLKAAAARGGHNAQLIEHGAETSVAGAIQLFIEFELLDGRADAFTQAFREVADIARNNGVTLRYDIYRDPAKPSAIFAIEHHTDAQSLGRHFELAFPAIQKAWTHARPVRTLILGNVPQDMRAMMEANGAAVVPPWLNN